MTMEILQKNKIFLLVFLVIALLSSPNIVWGAEEVRLVSDVSSTGKANAAALQTLVEYAKKLNEIQDSLLQKERRDDPIQSQISAEATGKSTQIVVKEVNGGDNGSPSYVESYENLSERISDNTVVEVVLGDTYEALPERLRFELQSGQVGYYLNDFKSSGLQSTIPSEEERATENPLSAIAMNFTDCRRDPQCLKLHADVQLYTRILGAQQTELDYAVRDHQGFKPQRLCRQVNTAEGQTREECIITVPPGALATASNYVFGEFPITAPLIADEYGETISQYITELGNQTFSSPLGSLALGGNLEFSINIFGEEGNLSYVDALIKDQPNKNLPELINPMEEALTAEYEYTVLQTQIADTIFELRSALATSTERFDDCFELELTDYLENVATTTEANLEISSTTIAILTLLQSQWDTTSDPVIRSLIINTFEDYKEDGYFRTKIDNFELKLKFIDLEFGEMVDNFKIDIDREIEKCGGDPIFNVNDDSASSTDNGT